MINLKKNINMLLIVAIVLVVVVALTTRFGITNNKSKYHSLERVFASTDELVENSDVIVIGQIIKIYEPKYVPVESTNESLEEIVVKIDIKLDKSLKGTLAKNKKISVEKIVGYRTNKGSIIKEGMKNYDAGERLILFLRENTNSSSYHLLNNYQGIIKVKGEKYSSFNINSEVEFDKNYFPMFDNNIKIKELEEKIKKSK